MTKSYVFRPKTERHLGILQQKPQNDKRAMRCYHCDPLGHVPKHASVADLVLPCLASLLEFVRDPGQKNEFRRLNCR